MEDPFTFPSVVHIDKVVNTTCLPQNLVGALPLGKQFVAICGQKDKHLITRLELAFAGCAIIPSFLGVLFCSQIFSYNVCRLGQLFLD